MGLLKIFGMEIDPIVKSTFEIRAFLAIIFSLTLVIGFFMKLIDHNVLIPIASMAIGWFFGNKKADVATDSKINDLKSEIKLLQENNNGK